VPGLGAMVRRRGRGGRRGSEGGDIGWDSKIRVWCRRAELRWIRNLCEEQRKGIGFEMYCTPRARQQEYYFSQARALVSRVAWERDPLTYPIVTCCRGLVDPIDVGPTCHPPVCQGTERQRSHVRCAVAYSHCIGKEELLSLGTPPLFIRALLTSPTSPSVFFFYGDDEKGFSCALASLISLRFGPSSIRRAQVIFGLPGRAQELWTKEMRAKRRGNFPRVVWPRLVGERGRSSSSSHRLPRIVFRAL
jgi:hypothetical protein